MSVLTFLFVVARELSASRVYEACLCLYRVKVLALHNSKERHECAVYT